MTDEQVLKALECCFSNKSCEGCPLDTNDADSSCLRIIRNEAVHLCLRQQAEIERLKQLPTHITVDKTAFEECCYNIETAKAEAYQEFAERLKDKLREADRFVVFNSDIDNLVKEMTEVSNGE